jgi:hypothetical protein
MRKKDRVWTFFTATTKENDDGVKIPCHQCKFCGDLFTSGASRMKSHLLVDLADGKIPTSDIDANQFLILEKKKQKVAEEIEGGGPSKRKASFISTYVDSISEETNIQLDKLLVTAFCSGNIPFSFVENEYFKQFIATIRPGYKLPNRMILSNELLTQQYEDIKKKVDEKIHNAHNIVLTVDEWFEFFYFIFFINIF